ncbi:MAG: Mur ligase domain-containing protein [Actinomycetota bacterium]
MSNLETLRDKQIHFVGIGGAGMSGIARIMLSAGLEISGSDIKESAITQSLVALGANVFVGHRPENINGVDVLIISNAISPLILKFWRHSVLASKFFLEQRH